MYYQVLRIERKSGSIYHIVDNERSNGRRTLCGGLAEGINGRKYTASHIEEEWAKKVLTKINYNGLVRRNYVEQELLDQITRTSVYRVVTGDICQTCLTSFTSRLREYLQHLQSEMATGRPKCIEPDMPTQKNESTSRRQLKIADIEFGGYAAIHLDGPVVNLDVTDGGLENEDRVQELTQELDSEFLNFNEKTFCATSMTLPGLLEDLEENVYTRSHSREEILQDLRDGKLIIVHIRSIPLNIVVEEKITRYITKFNER